jgi:hypothetical protein
VPRGAFEGRNEGMDEVAEIKFENDDLMALVERELSK